MFLLKPVYALCKVCINYRMGKSIEMKTNSQAILLFYVTKCVMANYNNNRYIPNI